MTKIEQIEEFDSDGRRIEMYRDGSVIVVDMRTRPYVSVPIPPHVVRDLVERVCMWDFVQPKKDPPENHQLDEPEAMYAIRIKAHAELRHTLAHFALAIEAAAKGCHRVVDHELASVWSAIGFDEDGVEAMERELKEIEDGAHTVPPRTEAEAEG